MASGMARIDWTSSLLLHRHREREREMTPSMRHRERKTKTKETNAGREDRRGPPRPLKKKNSHEIFLRRPKARQEEAY